MLNGIYSAAAGMAAQQARLDAVSNDLANVSTTGYKAVRIGMRDLAYTDRAGASIGAGSAAVDAGRSFAQGAFTETGRPLSLAIEGAGFFQVRRGDGTLALTRAGDFRLDAGGALVSATGERLQPALTVPPGTDADKVKVELDGRVQIDGLEIGRVVVVDVPAPSALQSVGDNAYVPTAASGAAAPVEGAKVRQGMLEASNVDVGQAMVGAIEAQRAFELASRALRIQDQLLETANGIRR